MPSFDCPRCGAALRRGRKFCNSCGLALAGCPACGGLNAGDARFCGDCGVALQLAPAAAPAAVEDTGGDAAPERRQLTVMFCDLVGSTALSDRLDPEDLQTVIAAFHGCAAELVGRFDGAVAQYLGDGMLVYFGYPHAHEDDAERSVRAALAIIAAVHELRPVEGVALQTRIGIATGLVVIGELVASGPQRRHAVIGKTPNLAARLQGIAEPDSVVIGAATRQLIHALFECADLGLHQLKGIASPVPAWRVVGERRTRSRFEALHEGALTPFIGRERELSVIRRRWAEAKAGRGQVVLLSGESGMGKSRLVQALLDGLRGESCYRLSYHGSPYHQNTAFHGVIELLERGAGLRPDDPPDRRLAKLERLLARSGADRPEAAASIAALLGIPTEARYPPPAPEPQQQRERIAGALLDHLAGLAARRPVVVNFEDAGLLDPSTLALLGRLIERAQTLPILVLITFRPSFDPPWAGYPHVLPIGLERLDRRRSLALIAEFAGPRPLPAAIVEQIVSQTDGVPLFIEEITRALLERDTHDAEAVELEVPSSLQDTLMARLDRLARAKPVAQLGAALGRAFSHELVAAVSSLDERELGRALDKLIAAGLIDRRGTPPQATYAFKHALVRDAAYASLLHSHRQRLHARIAETLEAQFPHTAAAQPELLANHCAAAGLVDKAIAYWQKAAAQADARLATAEAIADLGRALALLGGLPKGGDPDRRELDLQLALGAQIMAAEGPSAPETGRIYTRASELARRLEERSPLFAALYGLGVFHFCRAELPQSRAISDEMLRLAEGNSDRAHRLTAHRVLAADLFMLGEFRQARRELMHALALYDPAQHGELRRVYAYDSRVVSAMYLAWTDFMLGDAAAAFAGCRASLAEARALEHPHTLAFALDAACVLHQWAGEHGTAKKQAAALLVVAERHDYAYWLAQAKMYRGWTLAATGDGVAGIAALHDGIAAHEATGGAIFVPYHLARLAQAHLAAGAVDAARSALGDALARVERSSERWMEAELHRLTGVALIADRRPAEAEACFRRSLAVAERQEARFWALSAATSLARLLGDEGRGSEAGALLAPVVGWFAADAPLPELCAARQLLATPG